jgi:hypothetical protein
MIFHVGNASRVAASSVRGLTACDVSQRASMSTIDIGDDAD